MKNAFSYQAGVVGVHSLVDEVFLCATRVRALLRGAYSCTGNRICTSYYFRNVEKQLYLFLT